MDLKIKNVLRGVCQQAWQDFKDFNAYHAGSLMDFQAANLPQDQLDSKLTMSEFKTIMPLAFKGLVYDFFVESNRIQIDSAFGEGTFDKAASSVARSWARINGDKKPSDSNPPEDYRPII